MFRCRYFSSLRCLLLLVAVAGLWPFGFAQAQEKLPQFRVPGHDDEMQLLQDLFQRHHSPRTACTLWDAWVPMSTLWPAVGDEASAAAMRAFYRRVLLNRQMDDDGYITMDQHRGHAHPGGWPFPLWQQAGGAGWHFTLQGDPYRDMMQTPQTDVKSLEIRGATDVLQDDAFGMRLTTVPGETAITLPARAFEAFVSPFVVIEWSSDQLPEDARPVLQWRGVGQAEFDEVRSVAVTPDSGLGGQYGAGLKLSIVPLHEHPQWQGPIEQLRLKWQTAEPVTLTIRNVHTAIDSRHPITSPLFVRSSIEYFRWTGDIDFLRQNIGRMRTALDYATDEFAVRENGAVLVDWPGHDGRRGFVRDAAGKKTLLRGHGVGNNYYDLLPFGHLDAYATILLFDALQAAAKVEQAITEHPEWNVSPPEGEQVETFAPDALLQLAEHLRQQAGRRFWDDSKGRFIGWIDADGNRADYGFTFLNLEAIYYGFATPEQAERIMQWIEGTRTIDGDTSTGADLYHWRFAPRVTTRRNVDWYCWVWHDPESIAWGDQIQDGGAVLGFSFHDLMARLETRGADNAWQRLQAILKWYGEVQAEGGYRAYYAKPGRGSLQGGGTPGGLGLDHEFMESVLVPQVMLYGFLGFEPQVAGFRIAPKLPEDWPSLEVTRIAWRDHVFDVKATPEAIEIRFRHAGEGTLSVELPEGRWINEADSAKGNLMKGNIAQIPPGTSKVRWMRAK